MCTMVLSIAGIACGDTMDGYRSDVVKAPVPWKDMAVVALYRMVHEMALASLCWGW